MRKRKYRQSKHNTNYLVFFLSILVLVETILLLFLLPNVTTPKKAPAKEKTIQITPAPKVAPKIPAAARTAPLPPKITPAQSVVPRKYKAKIAIVIDDWGYNNDNLETLKDIEFPLTLAILPFRPYSRNIAEFAHAHAYEVIIHMPMEPLYKENRELEPKTILASMNKREIKNLVNAAILDMPHAKGMNNHMGSLLTTDQRAMTVIMAELKKREFYFLDSLVTPSTICAKLAKKTGVKFTKRFIFIDNKSDTEYIRAQLMELVEKADRYGYALGIGHDRKNTLKVIQEVLPQIAEEGYQFVYASELTTE